MVVVLLTGLALQALRQHETIRLSYAGGLTERNSDLGTAGRDGLLAVDAINAGEGIGGNESILSFAMARATQRCPESSQRAHLCKGDSHCGTHEKRCYHSHYPDRRCFPKADALTYGKQQRFDRRGRRLRPAQSEPGYCRGFGKSSDQHIRDTEGRAGMRPFQQVHKNPVCLGNHERDI